MPIMSIRRKVGDWIKIKPNCGFYGDFCKIPLQIIDELFVCCPYCDDEDCKQWGSLLSLEIEGQRYPVCNVSECQMMDCNSH